MIKIQSDELFNESNRIISNNQSMLKILFKNDVIIRDYYQYISLTPYVLQKDQDRKISLITKEIGKLLEKTIRLYFEDVEVKEFVGDQGINEKYVQDFTVYKNNPQLFLGRFDGFIDENGDIKFLELNVDYPGGYNRVDIINDRVASLGYSDSYDCKTELLDVFLKMCVKLYNQHKTKDDEIFAIIYGSNDIERKYLWLKEIAKKLRDMGIPTHTFHFNELVEKKEGLYHEGKKITLVFHAPFLRELWELDPDDSEKVVRALEKDSIFMFNGPGAVIGSKKNLFALWHANLFQKYLSTDEKKVINESIPKTYIYSKECPLIEDKNKCVIKPIVGYGGIGVIVGKKSTKKEWDDALQKCNNDPDNFIVQEYMKPTTSKIVEYDIKSKKYSEKEVLINISPWYIDGDCAGFSGRYSQDHIINIKQGGGMIPIFIEK